MEIDKHNKYKIRIADGKSRCIEANGERGKGFVPPDVEDNLPKLYVVKRANEIYYVGITTQDIRKRLRQGFSAKGEHGYHGYKWKDQDEVELLIWCFRDTTTRDYVEAVEAELVYLIREKTGKWPKYQMEIHFHRTSGDQLEDARSILRKCLNEA